MIVANIEILNAWQNVVKSDEPEWREVLDRKRRLWLFSQVFPSLAGYLGRGEVLNLRKVCDSWSKGVDKFLDEADHPTPYNVGERSRDGSPPRMIPVPVNPIFLQDFQYIIGTVLRIRIRGGQRFLVTTEGLDVDAFIESIGESQRNPIIGRLFRILQNTDFVPLPMIQTRVDRLFHRFGHHLTYVDLMSTNTMTITEFLRMIGTVLNNAPNLKQFLLWLTARFVEEDANERLERVQVPVLPHLRTLELTYRPPDPPQVPPPVGLDVVLELMRDLIRNHAAQLGRLEIRGMEADHWIELSWPNLTELHVVLEERDGVNLSSLMTLDAPQLAKLILKMEPDFMIRLEDFVRLKDRFPMLRLVMVAIASRYF